MKMTPFTHLHAHPEFLLKRVIQTNHPLEVAISDQQSVVVLSKQRYEQLLELNYLWAAGSLPQALQQAQLTASNTPQT
ncbi:hypothetical protein ACUIJQ_00485 [Levilactobacillus hammesii]|uniref:Antitoxin n=1 Tax=Levilactobacillus hammesii DSM 16381 TaxID=1423753 RepID=A0A0R1UTR4_9LACO|nr:hypothetical protein [Levilactobacillus hammesii]KRL94402.1 hypothetical protein FD28_GL000554 [Levilactobacillus hammesii DSM 16381]